MSHGLPRSHGVRQRRDHRPGRCGSETRVRLESVTCGKAPRRWHCVQDAQNCGSRRPIDTGAAESALVCKPSVSGMLAVNPTPLQRGVIRNECQDAVTLDAVVQHGLYVAIAQSAEPLPHKRVRAGSLLASGTNPRKTEGIFMPARQAGDGRTFLTNSICPVLPGGFI